MLAIPWNFLINLEFYFVAMLQVCSHYSYDLSVLLFVVSLCYEKNKLYVSDNAMMVQSCYFVLAPFQFYSLIYLISSNISFLFLFVSFKVLRQ